MFVIIHYNEIIEFWQKSFFWECWTLKYKLSFHDLRLKTVTLLRPRLCIIQSNNECTVINEQIYTSPIWILNDLRSRINFDTRLTPSCGGDTNRSNGKHYSMWRCHLFHNPGFVWSFYTLVNKIRAWGTIVERGKIFDDIKENA